MDLTEKIKDDLNLRQIIEHLNQASKLQFNSKDNKAEYLEMVNTWKSQINTIERLLK